MHKPLDTLKIEADIARLMAETMKLHAEAAKMRRETAWYPLVVGAALATAVLTLSRILS